MDTDSFAGIISQRFAFVTYQPRRAMVYAIRETFYTLQGEGAMSGRAAVFLRFAGCNLWTGREEDRAGAVCRFCDTEFRGTDGPGGGKFQDQESLGQHVESIWSAGTDDQSGRYVVCTGGEPLLQLDTALIGELHRRGFEIAVESNGTIEAPAGIDWICISPKAAQPLKQRSGAELKLVFPQSENSPREFEELEFAHFYLQPLDGPDLKANMDACVAYCMKHPKWRLSLQSHKVAGFE